MTVYCNATSNIALTQNPSYASGLASIPSATRKAAGWAASDTCMNLDMAPDGGGPPPPDAPSLSIVVGLTCALCASFVQSLGLTLQRRSHLENEARPSSLRRRDWQRPLWLLGFAIFISSNILGSVFQLASLSIVILAPLGAVSLLWNAFFARILLGDVFSRYLVIGTILIAGGAVLIAIFGVVPETTHSLEELLALYARSSFIIWIALQAVIIIAVLAVAHWSEARLESHLQDVYIALPTSDDDGESGMVSPLPRRSKAKARKVRRWSTPPAYLSLNIDNAEDSPNTPPAPSPGLKASLGALGSPAYPETPLPPSAKRTNSRHVSFGPAQYKSPTVSSMMSESQYKRSPSGGKSESTVRPRLAQDRAEKIRLWLGIAYGSASGTMSGLCLLFAKTGVELLILTVMGKNQFKRWESWMIVLALLVCALLQLWYLNKSLRLVGPTLICPLAFCFYNLSSIFNGLMYYNQWSLLSGLQDGLMSLGIVILLAGVWIVSIKSSDGTIVEGDSIDLESSSEEEEELLNGEERGSGYGDDEGDGEEMDDDRSPEEETFGDLKGRIANLYQAFLLDQAGPPRGFSVGISASSPGFAIRPQHHVHHHHHHQRRNTAASTPSLPKLQTRHSHSRSDASLVSSPTDVTAVESSDLPPRPTLANRTASDPTAGAAGTITSATKAREQKELLSHRHRRKRSLAGDFYVGASDPFAEQPAFEVPPSPTSASLGRRRSSSQGSQNRRLENEEEPEAGSGNVSPRRTAGLRRFLPWTAEPERPAQD